MPDEMTLGFYVRQILSGDNSITVEKLAGKMGLSKDNLDARLHGRANFRPHEIQSLLRAYPDVRIVRFLLQGTPFTAVDRRRFDSLDELASLERSALHVSEEVGDLARTMLEALLDEKICHNDVTALTGEIVNAEEALAGVRHSLERTTSPAVKD